jgi:tRNA modification GTPase
MSLASREPATTIAAVATPPGTGALSLIRISGPRALDVASAATGTSVQDQPSHTSRHRSILDESGNRIDDGLLTVFRAPASATGEDGVEFTGHGGVLVTRQVLERFFTCGAHPAGPGEFTQRAFLNGRLDLTQAEAVMDIISARTSLSLRAARNQLDGRLGKRTGALRDDLLETLAHLEAWIDFPEEDISPETGIRLLERVTRIRTEIESLLSTADQGRILREGARTVIHGPPNAGKSSLLNHLLGQERAIVCETAGTTRDTIEEAVNFHGIPLRLIDTAGVRHTEDQVEKMGIMRTWKEVESADLVLSLADGSQPKEEQSEGGQLPSQTIRILNKADLPEHPSWSDTAALRVSCLTGQGMEELSRSLFEMLHVQNTSWGDDMVAVNARHAHSLTQAAHALDAARPNLAHDSWNPELASIDLREALDLLGEIPGKVDTEDLLGVIFSRFCIGK